jgi:hypothetical protein
MPATRDIDIYRGDNFAHTVTITNTAGSAIDVSGRTYTSQLRRYPDSSTVAATFTVSMASAVTGVVVFSLANTVTASLDPGPYHYDIQQNNGGTLTTLLAGRATLAADVTRAS